MGIAEVRSQETGRWRMLVGRSSSITISLSRPQEIQVNANLVSYFEKEAELGQKNISLYIC